MKNKILSILNSLNKNQESQLSIKNTYLNKKTARARAKALIIDSNNNLHILEVARNNTEKFYLDRTVQIPSTIDEKYVVRASLHGNHDGLQYALFPFITGSQHFSGDPPLEVLEKIQGRKFQTELNSEQTSKILEGFLSSWPNELHSNISRMNLFEEFAHLLQKTKEIVICNEHGDLSPNNLLHNNSLKVIDFEFYRPYQIADFDIFYNKKVRGISVKNEMTTIDKIHQLKLDLINAINKDFDLNVSNTIFHISKHIETVVINGESLGEKKYFLSAPRTDHQIQLFIEKSIKCDINIGALVVYPGNLSSVKKYTSIKKVLMHKIAMWGYSKTIKKILLGKILFYRLSAQGDSNQIILKNKRLYSL
jgi:hypothetical protein